MLAALPEGAEVHTALSETLAELGITAEIEESGRYDSVRQKLKGLDREKQGREMRKLGAAPGLRGGQRARRHRRRPARGRLGLG